MELVLYKTKSANNKLNKSLTDKKKIEGTLRQESSIKNPIITINSADNNLNLADYNYAYIKKFNRYYFIKDYDSVRTHLLRLYLRRDVLYTYREEIRNCEAIVVHQDDDKNTKATIKTKYTNKMMNDGTYPVAVNRQTKIINFENGDDTSIMKANNCYLITLISATEVTNNG